MICPMCERPIYTVCRYEASYCEYDVGNTLDEVDYIKCDEGISSSDYFCPECDHALTDEPYPIFGAHLVMSNDPLEST